jgi:FkbM family methyltransferase
MKLVITTKDIDKIIEELTPLVKIFANNYDNGLVLYGAGFLGEWAAKYLKSSGAKVNYFLDSNDQKNNLKVDGIPIYKPSDDTLKQSSLVLITARHAISEIGKFLDSYNVRWMSFDAFFVVHNYLKFSHVRDTFFDEEFSINTYNALLMNMLTGKLMSKDLVIKDMYFCLPEFSGKFDETFVDAGAFVGDTVERFIWENLGTFRKIFAFEPGYRQFKAMEKRVNRLIDEWAIEPSRIMLIKAGLSSQPGRMSCTFLEDYPLRHGLSATNQIEDFDEINSSKVDLLDNFVKDEKITFLKVDVEGMEMELLKGATQTILKSKPKIAICVYHYPCDLYMIPEYIRSLVPKYKFALRHHAPVHGDFVLYCYL